MDKNPFLLSLSWDNTTLKRLVLTFSALVTDY